MMVNISNLNRDRGMSRRRPLVTGGDIIASVAVVAVLIGSAIVGGVLAWFGACCVVAAVAVIGGAHEL